MVPKPPDQSFGQDEQDGHLDEGGRKVQGCKAQFLDGLVGLNGVESDNVATVLVTSADVGMAAGATHTPGGSISAHPTSAGIVGKGIIFMIRME